MITKLPSDLCHLSKSTCDALETRRASMAESIDPTGDPETAQCLIPVVGACAAVLALPLTGALRTQPMAQTELAEYITGDMDSRERNPILRDLCRSGYFGVRDPNSVCSRRIATMVVDGQKFEVGSYT